MNKKEQNKSELILYQTEDAKTRLEVRLQDETVWLTQKMMVDLLCQHLNYYPQSSAQGMKEKKG